MSDNDKPVDTKIEDDSKIKEESKIKDESKNKEESKKKDDNKKQSFIPLDKQSKHRQKEYNMTQRGTWGGINPVTRKPPNPKAYNRRKTGR